MKKVRWLAMIAAVFAEVTHWTGAAAWLCILALTLIFGQQAFEGTVLGQIFTTSPVVDQEISDYRCQTLDVYGLQITGTEHYEEKYVKNSASEDGEVLKTTVTYNQAAIAVYSAGAALIMILIALVFHYMFWILKTAKKENTPFTPKIAQMVRNTGILLISVSFICLAASAAAGFITGVPNICISIQTIILGIFVLCLAGFFRHGIRLEKDAKDLTEEVTA